MEAITYSVLFSLSPPKLPVFTLSVYKLVPFLFCLSVLPCLSDRKHGFRRSRLQKWSLGPNIRKAHAPGGLITFFLFIYSVPMSPCLHVCHWTLHMNYTHASCLHADVTCNCSRHSYTQMSLTKTININSEKAFQMMDKINFKMVANHFFLIFTFSIFLTGVLTSK